MTARIVILAAAASGLLAGAEAARFGYRVVRTYPHDPAAFTQGLEYRGGALYEGTGLWGKSRVRKVDLATGSVVKEIEIDPKYFGEGITVLNGQIVQLTWQSQKGFVYDQATLKLLREFSYTGEGWGLANDGRQIYMSDGTAEIRCWNPATFGEQRRFTVHDGTAPVHRINELEWVRGEIWANVWQSDRIARISPKDGRVLGWIDLSGLLDPGARARADVLNGIAYDPLGNRIFVTGKLWPKIFEIQVTPLRKPTPSK